MSEILKSMAQAISVMELIQECSAPASMSNTSTSQYVSCGDVEVDKLFCELEQMKKQRHDNVTIPYFSRIGSALTSALFEDHPYARKYYLSLAKRELQSIRLYLH